MDEIIILVNFFTLKFFINDFRFWLIFAFYLESKPNVDLLLALSKDDAKVFIVFY